MREQNRNRIKDNRLFDIINILLLLIILFIMIYPFWNVLVTSLSDPKSLALKGTTGFLPRGLSFEGYRLLIQEPTLPRYYLNTILYLVLGTVFKLFLSIITGYALSVRRFFLGKPIMILMVITMFIGGGLIPYFLLVRQLGMINSIWVMIIPGALDVYNCIVFKTFFQQLPGELYDAAAIDGANDIILLWKVVVPISKALIATFSIFAIVGYWNGWWDALLFLNKQEMHPIQMYLRKILVSMEMMAADTTGAASVRTGLESVSILRTVRSAAIVVTTLPIICVYPFFQKYFTKGVIVGSLKG